jgi:hypothetical protein
MVAINFTIFVDKVASGEKCQTIRQKARCKPGDRLQLYTGMRTKACRKLGEGICTDVDYCSLRLGYITFGDASRHPSANEFARADGFPDYATMVKWFQDKYARPVFVGYVIKWRKITPGAPSPADRT